MPSAACRVRLVPVSLTSRPLKTRPSTVAAECSLSCRLALFPGQEVAWLQARVEDAVARAARDHAYLAAHPPRVRYDGFAGEGVEVPADAPIVRAVSAAHEAVSGAGSIPSAFSFHSRRARPATGARAGARSGAGKNRL